MNYKMNLFCAAFVCSTVFFSAAGKCSDTSSDRALSNSDMREILAKYDDQQINEAYSGLAFYPLPGQGVVLQTKATALSNNSSHANAIKLSATELAKVTLDDSEQGQKVKSERSSRRTSQQSSKVVFPDNQHVYIDLFCQREKSSHWPLSNPKQRLNQI